MVESTRLAYGDDFVAQGARAYTEGRYFEAHEHFEAAWLASGTPRSTELQALAQIAAAMHKLVAQGKAVAARAILARAREKLGRLDVSQSGVDLVALRRSIDRFLGGDETSRPVIVVSR